MSRDSHPTLGVKFTHGLKSGNGCCILKKVSTTSTGQMRQLVEDLQALEDKLSVAKDGSMTSPRGSENWALPSPGAPTWVT